MAVVQKAVQDAGAHHRVAVHAAPLADSSVAGYQYAPALVASAYQLDEQMGCIGLKRQIAEFSNDQQLGLALVT